MSLKPHKNAEVIKAFADGKDIQWKVGISENWHDFNGDYSEGPWVNDAALWRVKPEGPWYRVGLFKYSTEDNTYTALARSEADEVVYESVPQFVRWLTERVSYEP